MTDPERPAMIDRPGLAALQSEANIAVGPRRVPGRDIPVPTGLDASHAVLVEAPYSPAWNLAPADDDGWRVVQRAMAERVGPILSRIRDELGITMIRTMLGRVGAYMLSPADLPAAHRDQLVFFLHGGGYVLGAGEAGTTEATLLAAYGRYRVVSIDYGVAPDRPHPAGLNDAVAAWCALTASHDPRTLALGGLSAGGGLALALLLHLRDEGLPMPAAVSLGSPWADMTRTGDSYATNEWLDNVLVSYDGYLSHAGRLYAAGHDLRDPALSPIYGDFAGLPPTILLTGTRDLFLSNTVRTHRKLRDAGVEADLQLFEGLSHAQFALTPGATVTRTACGEISRFFDRHLIAAD
ncbi:alpha/beta hydrolase fold domain-containing protein [uncultured Sphingomonas sp.]|uniref:alpha/beta hydrolase fold domain-containing protein n=1 Tax=uncultured Sphingomonas sp. TaxID=158754 RepID=UPI0035CA7BEB